MLRTYILTRSDLKTSRQQWYWRHWSNSFDFAKAFDKLNHDLLIRRLNDLNFLVDLIHWINDYLKNRSQRIRIGSKFSNIESIKSGVPQGSLIGPYLFCIFASTLTSLNREKCSIIKFADDSTAIIPCLKSDPMKIQVIDEHNNVKNWSAQNKLPLNIKKCTRIVFSRNPSYSPASLNEIKISQCFRYLGVLINNKLKWSDHIKDLISQCNKTLYILRILKPFSSKSELISVYFAFTRSKIEYCTIPCSLAWTKISVKC